MPIITILQPKPVPQYTAGDDHTKTNSDSFSSDSDSEASDGGGADLEGDIAMAIKAESRKRPAAAIAANSNKRARDYGSDIVTPGEIITDDSQWMRFVLFYFVLYTCIHHPK